jgi:hypothetical protein
MQKSECETKKEQKDLRFLKEAGDDVVCDRDVMNLSHSRNSSRHHHQHDAQTSSVHFTITPRTINISHDLLSYYLRVVVMTVNSVIQFRFRDRKARSAIKHATQPRQASSLEWGEG